MSLGAGPSVSRSTCYTLPLQQKCRPDIITVNTKPKTEERLGGASVLIMSQTEYLLRQFHDPQVLSLTSL